MWKSVLILIGTVCLTSSGSFALTMWNVGTGTEFQNFPTASPGVQFTWDYTPWLNGSLPCQSVELWLNFDCQTSFSTLNIQLDSSSTIFTFAPFFPGGSQMTRILYDPAYVSPGAGIPSSVLPQAWKDELADGVLRGRAWVVGAPSSPQRATLTGQLTYLTPEPATLSMLLVGAAALLRRRKGNIASLKSLVATPAEAT